MFFPSVSLLHYWMVAKMDSKSRIAAHWLCLWRGYGLEVSDPQQCVLEARSGFEAGNTGGALLIFAALPGWRWCRLATCGCSNWGDASTRTWRTQRFGEDLEQIIGVSHTSFPKMKLSIHTKKEILIIFVFRSDEKGSWWSWTRRSGGAFRAEFPRISS